MTKTWNIIFTAVVGFVSLSLSVIAMDETCDYHQDRFTRNSRCHQGWCSVDKAIASRISQQLTEEREKKAAYWGVSTEKYKEMTTPTVYKIPHYEVSYSTTPLPRQNNGGAYNYGTPQFIMPSQQHYSPNWPYNNSSNTPSQSYAQMGHRPAMQGRQLPVQSSGGKLTMDERVDLVRTQLETQEYLNTCLNTPHETLNEAINKLEQGNNRAIWTTVEIDQFRADNKAGNAAKHKWQ